VKAVVTSIIRYDYDTRSYSRLAFNECATS